MLGNVAAGYRDSLPSFGSRARESGYRLDCDCRDLRQCGRCDRPGHPIARERRAHGRAWAHGSRAPMTPTRCGSIAPARSPRPARAGPSCSMLCMSLRISMRRGSTVEENYFTAESNQQSGSSIRRSRATSTSVIDGVLADGARRTLRRTSSPRPTTDPQRYASVSVAGSAIIYTSLGGERSASHRCDRDRRVPGQTECAPEDPDTRTDHIAPGRSIGLHYNVARNATLGLRFATGSFATRLRDQHSSKERVWSAPIGTAIQAAPAAIRAGVAPPRGRLERPIDAATPARPPPLRSATSLGIAIPSDVQVPLAEPHVPIWRRSAISPVR